MLIRSSLMALGFILIAGTAASAQTQWHTGRNGSPAGKTVRLGDTDRHYDARGNRVGRSTTFGGRTHHYDARGNLIGKSSPQFRERRSP